MNVSVRRAALFDTNLFSIQLKFDASINGLRLGWNISV